MLDRAEEVYGKDRVLRSSRTSQWVWDRTVSPATSLVLSSTLEANTDYWRKTPHVKRLVMKSVPEATTRLAMLKKQEADVTYALYGVSSGRGAHATRT